MQNRILVLIVVILIPIVVISFNKKETNFNLPKNNITVRIKDVDNGEVINIDLEEYVIGVVAAEMPASFGIEALKAQAVAARTYAYYKIKHNNSSYDLVTDISDQSYITTTEMQDKWDADYQKYYDKISTAVKSTEYEILTYEDEVIQAFYFAMSNGYTEDSSLVFSEAEPYLESVESEWDNETLNNFQVDTTIKKEAFCNLLALDCTSLNISNVQRSSSNRVNSIVINNKEFKGTEIRKLLNLRSTDFDINVSNFDINITTYGYGHGVGMSQYGANGMAKEGYTYDAILKYYYTDVILTKI